MVTKFMVYCMPTFYYNLKVNFYAILHLSPKLYLLKKFFTIFRFVPPEVRRFHFGAGSPIKKNEGGT